MVRKLRKTKVNKKHRRHTMRGGFRDVKDACDQIKAARDGRAKLRIYRKAVLQFHPDAKSGTGSVKDFQTLEDCYNVIKNEAPFEYEGGPPKPVYEEPEPEPAPPPPPRPKPAPAPAPAPAPPPRPRARAEPGPPPAPAPSPKDKVESAYLRKGNQFDPSEYFGEHGIRLSNVLSEAYAERVDVITNAILADNNIFVLSMNPGATEEDLLNHLNENYTLSEEDILRIVRDFQVKYPDITSPTTRHHNIVIVIP